MPDAAFPFTITTTLSRDEAIRGMKAIARGQLKRRWLYLLCMAALLCIVFFNLFNRSGKYDLADIPLIGGGLAIAAAAIIFKRRNAYIRAYNGNRRLHQPITYTFREAGMAVSGDGFRTEHTWANLNRIEVLRDVVLIYSSTQMANLIMRKYITDEQIALLQSKVGR